MNDESYPDLFLALKGGSNNLGVVTRFDMEAFEQGGLWGGSITNSPHTTEQNIDAFVNFTSNLKHDPYASLVQSYTYTNGSTTLMNELEYTKAVENPPAYAQLQAIPQVNNSLALANLSTLVNPAIAFNVSGS